MKRSQLKKNKGKRLIWFKARFYIDFIIFVCCLVITFNIHPTNIENNTNDTTEKTKMIYIFHDYEWNEFILNDTIHGSANSWDYLFVDDIPESIKWESENSVSLWINSQETNDNDMKNNQISIDDMINDLWIDDVDLNNGTNDNTVVINLSSGVQENTNIEYTIKEEAVNDTSILIIEKINNQSDNLEDNLLTAQTFSFTTDGWLLPTLIPRDEIIFNNSIYPSKSYIDDSGYIVSESWINSNKNESTITILDDYKDCITPWWYKIVHWDSVLAYKQLDNAPNICNIERRYCWNWKLSGTYTQQGCAINENFTYEQWWEAEVVKKVEGQKKSTVQNDDWTISVKNPETTWSFVFDRPSRSHTEYYYSDNIRPEDPEIEQSKRPHRDCTAPWWEKIEHGTFVQAFKHSNWFSDAPCEAQLRLCTNGNLMWNYPESSCKTRDTSFIDWINWSPTRDTYSKEKLEWVKKLIKAEKNYNKDFDRFTNSEELDKILNILDS